MFNSKFVDFLKTFNKISNGVILEYPVTVGKTDCSDVGFKFDISQFDDSGFSEKIGLIDLSSFLNIFNLVDDPEIGYKDGVITTKGDGCNVSYITSAIDIISQFEFSPKQFEVMDSKPSVAEFPLTANDIKKLKSAASSFKELNAITIKGDESISISLTQVGKFSQSSNSFEIVKGDFSSEKNFSKDISIETFGKIPVIDYTVKVKYNEAKDAYRFLFVADNIPGFELFVSTNVY